MANPEHPELVSLRDALHATFEKLDDVFSRPGPPIMTGFEELDQVTGGLGPGLVLVGASRPPVATRFVVELVRRATEREPELHVLFLSTANTEEQVARKLLSVESRVDLHDSNLTRDEMTALTYAANDLSKRRISLGQLSSRSLQALPRAFKAVLRPFSTSLSDAMDRTGDPTPSQRPLVVLDSIDDLDPCPTGSAWQNAAVAGCLTEIARDHEMSLVVTHAAGPGELRRSALTDAADAVLRVEGDGESDRPRRLVVEKTLLGECGAIRLDYAD